jgi:excisionase family DNA binding protein
VEDELLTVAEVAGRLLNQRTVRSWIDQGSLPVVRVGRRVSIERKDFDGFGRGLPERQRSARYPGLTPVRKHLGWRRAAAESPDS